ncbi:MAG: PQQ-binding-like beta-propeller repeat protein, partial [Planctomycetota bacterium]|nr:PQQ-binding-like beta-propeller repeat protein [Planctomycetota bacterium]
MKRVLFALLLLVGGWLHPGFPVCAHAENWPGWRKDGTGVSSEIGVPLQWGPDTNIRWKTPIPGEGLSSPIVWDDQVLVTTARRASQRHPLLPAALIVLSLFCAVALWCAADGTLRDPLGTMAVPWTTESRRRRWLRKSLASLLFVGVGYGTIMGVERAYDLFEKYPESLRNRLFDKTWYFTDVPGAEEIHTPLSAFRIFSGGTVPGPFFGAPRIPKGCYYAGFLAMFSVLVVNTVIAGRRRSGQEQPPPTDRETVAAGRPIILGASLPGTADSPAVPFGRPLITVLCRLLDWLTALAVSCFLITIHSAAMADLPYAPAGNTWFLAGSIGALGLIAFMLWLPPRGWLRLGGLLVACAVLAYIVLAAPENEAFGIRATAVRAGFPRLVKLLAGLSVVGIAVAFLTPAPSGLARSVRRAWSARCLGSAAILLAAGSYFGSSHFLLPHEVYVREVVSVDRKIGETQWIAKCHAGDISGEMHAANSMATATPVTDGERIYAHFSEAGLFCLDMTGDVQWRYDEPVPPAHWGAASSPILWQDLVIMTYDTDHHSLTVGIDKRSGAQRWRSDRTSQIVPSQLLDAYTTPVIIERNGNAELIHQACKLLVGYEPATGAERWAFSHVGEQPVPSPVVSEDLIIVLGGKYAPYLGAVRIHSEGDSEVAEEVWNGRKG